MKILELYPLAISRNGDDLFLSQDDESCVAMHVSQLRIVAEAAGLLAPAGLPADLLRRLNRLRDDAIELWGLLDSVCAFPPRADNGEDEDVARARRLIEDIESLLADYTGSAPRNGNSPEPCNEKAEGISVTPAQPGRGRPATGQAMTNAERQARFRAKQADLLTEGAAS